MTQNKDVGAAGGPSLALALSETLRGAQGAMIKAEPLKWRRLIRDAGIQPE